MTSHKTISTIVKEKIANMPDRFNDKEILNYIMTLFIKTPKLGPRNNEQAPINGPDIAKILLEINVFVIIFNNINLVINVNITSNTMWTNDINITIPGTGTFVIIAASVISTVGLVQDNWTMFWAGIVLTVIGGIVWIVWEKANSRRKIKG